MDNNKIIIFIVQGDKSTGLGHFYRSLVLAKKLRSADFKIRFYIIGNVEIFKELSGNQFEVYPFTDSFAEEISVNTPHWILLDLFSAEDSFIEKISLLGINLCGFGFPDNQLRFFKVSVNVADGRGPQNDVIQNDGRVRLRGSKYSLLREDILQHKGVYKFSHKISKILVMFGGADPLFLSEKIAANLNRLKRETEVFFIMGKLNSSDESKTISKNFKSSVIKDTNKIAELMLSCDIVIGSPGNGLFETWSLGIPYIGFFQNTNQELEFKNFPHVYKWSEDFDLEEEFVKFEKDYINYKKFIDGLNVGNGIDEVVELLQLK